MKVFDFKCPNCNGPLFFEEGQDVCICDYCGTQCHLEKVVDDLQKENAAGIKELTDRAYDLIRQGKFKEATEVAKEGLKTYPYAGRLHLTLLLCELNLRKPSLLGSYGKDYSTSVNFQSCVRYMDEQDKNDLLSLAAQNGCATIPQPTPAVQPTPEPAPEPKVTVVPLPPAPAPQPAPAPVVEPVVEPIDEEDFDSMPESEPAPKPIAKEKKGFGKWIQRVGLPLFIFTCILLVVGIGSFIFLLMMSINVGGIWRYVLIGAGVVYFGIAALGMLYVSRMDRVVCPKCNYKPRKHTRYFIETKALTTSSGTTLYDFYDDYWTCPQCGEQRHEIIKKSHIDSIYPASRNIE